MNDLIQFTLICVAALIIAVVAILETNPQQIMAAVPVGWDRLFFGWRLDLDWSNLIPQVNEKLYGAVGKGGDGYSLFLFFVLMLFLKGVLVSMAGPTPNYAIQHVLSTRSPREAALENMMMSIASLAPRFLLIAGIAVLGIAFFQPELRAKVDFDAILPTVVHRHLPVGCRGIIIAGLLAAFMSTFVSTVNSGTAYVVNDIYKRYINPNAPPRRYVILGYLGSLAVIALGIAFGIVTESVHSNTEALVSAIVPAFVIPNVLKWYWWRFNGYGFFAGMAAGTLSALALLFVNKGDFSRLIGLEPLNLHPISVFMIILALSTLASVVVCLATAPESDEVLKSFYRIVRPWGAWGPVYEKLRAEIPSVHENQNFGRDLLNLAVGLVWQTSMVALPIYLVIQQWGRTGVCLAVFAATSLILKFTWYDKLGPGEMYLRD